MQRPRARRFHESARSKETKAANGSIRSTPSRWAEMCQCNVVPRKPAWFSRQPRVGWSWTKRPRPAHQGESEREGAGRRLWPGNNVVGNRLSPTSAGCQKLGCSRVRCSECHCSSFTPLCRGEDEVPVVSSANPRGEFTLGAVSAKEETSASGRCRDRLGVVLRVRWRRG